MNFLKSFRYAWHGIRYVFKNERNFRIQVYVAIFVFICAWFFELGRYEVMAVGFLVLLVLILELLNSALEKFVDILKPRLHLQVEIVKDIMAAMVLVAAVGSVIIGLTIFLPHVLELGREAWYNIGVL